MGGILDLRAQWKLRVVLDCSRASRRGRQRFLAGSFLPNGTTQTYDVGVGTTCVEWKRRSMLWSGDCSVRGEFWLTAVSSRLLR